MKKFVVLLLLSILPVYAPAQKLHSEAFALTHVTVIDMTGSPPKPEMTVLVMGNRIAAIGRVGHTRVPRGAQILDATGNYLIPGLWDMHVHFTEIERSFPLFIANGVTGVRNMGGELEDLLRWRAEVASGKLLGPRIVTCGPIVDGPQPAAHGPTIVVGTAAEGRQTVDTLKQRGADCVKVYDRLPRDAYFAIIDEAKKQKFPVVGHVPLSVTTMEASDAGQKSIEHLGTILQGCSTTENELRRLQAQPMPSGGDFSEIPRRIAARGERMLDTYDEQRAKVLFSHLTRNQTWQVPTLVTKRALTFVDDFDRNGDERLKYIPLSEQQWWSPQKNFLLRYRTPKYMVYSKRLFQRELELVGAMNRAGVLFMTGTDLSIPYTFAGFSLHDELGLFVQAGLTPMQALQAATRNPAIFLGEQSSQGTIERGKIANLLLLEANPLEDIRNTQRINAVIINGRYLPKGALQKMLADVEGTARR
ncbi:MAG: amidohydrolase family protein [bacterium]